eukprot:TRINITY_DN6138_c0_g1_i2.p1 TRINITY_DN6138_c0_g1~~TRINITY_DN6138_c0_g1_i2.p1  ORF type:complete len:1360 (+),score=174.02 TRINITY_DN6138_c0_g1_i2:80-4159(+)
MLNIRLQRLAACMLVFLRTCSSSPWTLKPDAPNGLLKDVHCITVVDDLWDTPSCFILDEENDLHITADAGASYSSHVIDSNLASNALRRVFFYDEHFGLVIGSSGLIYKTVDGGSSWSSKDPGTSRSLNTLYIQSATVAWIGANAGELLKSEDAGDTWQVLVDFGSTAIEDMACLGPVCVLACQKAQVVRSEDYGATWTVNNEILGFTQRLKAIALASESLVVAAGQEGLVLRSADGGMSWSKIEIATTLDIKAVKFRTVTEGYIVTQHQEGLFKTVDGGLTWCLEYLPSSSGKVTVGIAFANSSSTNFGMALINNAAWLYTTEAPLVDTASCTTTTITATNMVTFSTTTTFRTLSSTTTVSVSTTSTITSTLTFTVTSRTATPTGTTTSSITATSTTVSATISTLTSSDTTTAVTVTTTRSTTATTSFTKTTETSTSSMSSLTSTATATTTLTATATTISTITADTSTSTTSILTSTATDTTTNTATAITISTTTADMSTSTTSILTASATATTTHTATGILTSAFTDMEKATTTEQGATVMEEPGPLSPAMAETVDAVYSAEEGLLANISSGNQTKVTSVVEGAVVVAQFISPSDLEEHDNVTIPAEGTTAAVSVPSSLVEELGGSVVVVIAAFEPEHPERLSKKGTEVLGGDAQAPRQDIVSGLVSIKIALPNASVTRVQGLEKPIVLSLPVNASEGAECAFFDEVNNRWSSEGLQKVGGSPTSPLLCATTHLTLFAAIWRGVTKALDCSQAELFSEEALRAVIENDWYMETGACMMWGMMIFMCFMLLAAHCLERRRKWRGFRDDKLFFVLVIPDVVEQEVLGGSIGEVTEEIVNSCCYRCCISIYRLVRECAAWVWSFLDPLWQEIVGGLSDVGASVVELIQAARDLLLESHMDEGKCGCTFLIMAGLGRACESSVLHQVSVMLYIHVEDVRQLCRHGNPHSKKERDQSFDPEPGQSTSVGPGPDTAENLSPSDANVESRTLGTKDLAATSPLRNSLPKISLPPTASSHHLKRVKLLIEMEQSVKEATSLVFEQMGRCRYLHLITWRLLVAKNVWLNALHYSISMPSTTTVLLLMALLAGDSTITALFYSGDVVSRRSKRSVNCKMEGFWEEAGQMLVVAAFTAVAAVLPGIFISHMAARSFKEFHAEDTRDWSLQLCVWRCKDIQLLLLTTIYTMSCCLFCSIFLANVTEEDANKFAISVLFTLALQAVVAPVFSAIVLTLLGIIGFCLPSVRENCATRLGIGINDAVDDLDERVEPEEEPTLCSSDSVDFSTESEVVVAEEQKSEERVEESAAVDQEEQTEEEEKLLQLHSADERETPLCCLLEGSDCTRANFSEEDQAADPEDAAVIVAIL